jgi:hypothetical protein
MRPRLRRACGVRVAGDGSGAECSRQAARRGAARAGGAGIGLPARRTAALPTPNRAGHVRRQVASDRARREAGPLPGHHKCWVRNAASSWSAWSSTTQLDSHSQVSGTATLSCNRNWFVMSLLRKYCAKVIRSQASRRGARQWQSLVYIGSTLRTTSNTSRITSGVRMRMRMPRPVR